MIVKRNKVKSAGSSIRWSLSVLLGIVLFCHGAQAHDFWLLPHNAESHSGDGVVFELRIGPGWPGVRSARLPGLVNTFQAWDAQGNQDVKGHDGALVIGHMNVRTPGATVATLTTNAARITLPANEFEDYLREEGLTKIITSRQATNETEQPATELFSRFAKTVILVDGKSQGFDRITGMKRELVPVTDPLTYQPGTPFTVRLLARRQPLAGIQIKAELNGSPPQILKGISDNNGNVVFILPDAGEWLFSAVDMQPADDPDADWRSLWASLTLPVAKGRKE